jgi:Reverse transcriptase (RNA-dependent DNA polymerase)
LEGKVLFSKFDIWKGYNNIWIELEDQYKAVFKMLIGTYVPQVLQFGQKNGPTQWMRLMFHNFKGWFNVWDQNHKGMTGGCYMDDFYVASNGMKKANKSHDDCCHHFLTICWQRRYTLKPSKYIWRQSWMEFLGVVIENGQLSIDLAKKEGISKWPMDLKDKHDVQRIMGML